MLVSISQYSFARTLSVGWELWYPYQYRDTDHKLSGLDVEIFNSIAKKANLDADYVELPWKRHLRYIESGDIDIALGSSPTKEREQYAYFTVPYRVETVKLFIRAGEKLPLKSISELCNTHYSIATERGYFYGDEFAKSSKLKCFQTHIYEVIDIEQSIEMLLKGRINGLLADPHTIAAFSKKYKITGQIEAHPVKIYQTKIHIMLSKKSLNKRVLTKIDNAIIALKNEGVIEKILSKWQLH